MRLTDAIAPCFTDKQANVGALHANSGEAQMHAHAVASTEGTSNRRIAVVVGILFFFQLITFMIGSSLIEKYLDGDASRTTLTLGVSLEMCAGLAVVAIGILMYQVLKVVDARLALGYPLMRTLEFAVSAILAIYLLTQLDPFPHRLLWVYIPTGIGGLILNYLLFISRMIPRAISTLGLVGYSLLLLTVPLELLGAVDANSAGELALLAPGGLYEFVILPVWLIARGFRPPVDRTVGVLPMQPATSQ